MSLILPSTQLHEELTHDLGFKLVVGPVDRQCLCPTLKWVQEFGDWLRLNARKYETEKFDCDDFAIWARHESSIALARNRKEDDCGHAVLFCSLAVALGENLNGIEGAVSMHACNVVRTPEGWVFLEPQNGRHCLAGPVLDRDAVSLLNLVLL